MTPATPKIKAPMNEQEFAIEDRREAGRKISASILIATYNSSWCLPLVLKALATQSKQNFEILIADDGSSDNTAALALKYPVFFITQKHLSFRKTRIVNEASRYVKSNYIILLDGDCIPHRDFVKAHLAERERGRYLAGRRVDIPKTLTQKFLALKKSEAIDRFLLRHFFKLERPNRLLVVKNPLVRKIFRQNRIIDMMGCNGSFWLSDFLAVDGYDERYVKAAREDGDLCARFKNKGLKIKSVKALALVYHLWHERQPYANDDLFEETKATGRIKAIKGLSSR